MVNACCGQLLSLIAALTCALGVADVVITATIYCSSDAYDPDWCSSTDEPYIWVWVSSGIWGSLPIFLTGLYGMCASSDPIRWRYFSLMIFLSAVVFSPAITVLSAIEVWRGSTSEYTFYTFDNGSLAAGSINYPNPNPWQAKFAIPLTVAILGGIMFLITGYMTLMICCCMSGGGAVTTPSTVVVAPQNVGTKQVVYQQRPQIRTTYIDSQAQCDPCSRFSSLPYLPTRYNNLPVYASGGGFSNFQGGGPSNAIFFSR